MLKVCLVTSKWEVSEPQSDLSAVSLPGGCVLRSVCVCVCMYTCVHVRQSEDLCMKSKPLRLKVILIIPLKL